ncbi:MAG: DinB family protein, partial [Armatimonadetes bacterium]|nr:DinB family protein [Armatimonadota bacterium]
METRVGQIVHSVRTARRMTLGFIDGIPGDDWFAQPIPGMNHIAWNLMHLMLAEDWGPTALGDPARPWVARYGDLVGQGPLADPS